MTHGNHGDRFHRYAKVCTALAVLAALSLLLVAVQSSYGLITGGEGNKPLHDPGWSKGAAAVFNHPGRVAWWEGPPFGGGQWHAECRGDAKALSAALAGFAKIDAPVKRLVVHDGAAHSFWLNPNRDKAKEEAARIDWIFVVWQPVVWEQMRKFPADLAPAEIRDAKGGPPVQIDVYAGNLRWADVVVPKGITVVDERLAAHGFTAADGTVLEGTVADLAGKPLAARVALERSEQGRRGRWTVVVQAAADAAGRWVIKKTPAGSHRLVVYADGYTPRIAGYVSSDDQPCWRSLTCQLAKQSFVSGRVTDEAGKPLAEATVRLYNVAAGSGGRYDSPSDYSATTDVEGRFRFDPVPMGEATVQVNKPGYCRPGLGLPVKTPAMAVTLAMKRSAQVRVTVDFSKTTRPDGYMVAIEPEGGSVVGSWGGSANLQPNGQYTFRDVPPGRYVLWGHPNPSSANQHTAKQTVELKGGETTEVTIQAK